MKTRMVKVVGYSALLVLTALLNRADAEQPTSTVRMFFVLLPVDAEVPRFEDVTGVIRAGEPLASVETVGSVDGLGYTEEMFTMYDFEGEPINLAGTKWSQNRARFYMKDGDTFGTNIWTLQEDLDGDGVNDLFNLGEGALALTGPHGDVTTFATAYGGQLFVGDSNFGKWFFTTTPASADYQLVVGIGLFHE